MGPYAWCESLREGVSIDRDDKELFYAEVVRLSPCTTVGPLHLSFCLTKWILNAGKASHESKSDPMSYLGKLEALCQFDGQRFRPEWYYWHFLPSESITPKGLQFNF